MENCGERIATLRRENGMTQGQLGEALCVSAQAVSKWERGLSEPDIGSIRKMASLFGVTIDYLLGADEEADEAEDEEEEEAEPARVVAVCTECGKALYEGEVYNRNGKALCAACNEHIVRQEKQAAEQKKRDEEYRRKVEADAAAAALAQRKYEAGRRLKKPLVIAGVVTGLWLILSIISLVTLGAQYILVAIFGIYLVYAIAFELSLSHSLLRTLFDRLTPHRNEPRNQQSSGCLGCLMVLFFGIFFIIMVLFVVAIIVVSTLLTSAVLFPIDLHRAIRDYKQ